MRALSSLIFLCFSAHLTAQIELEATLQWEEPRLLEIDGQRYVEYGFRQMEGNSGADAGAMVSGLVPEFVETIAVSSGRPLVAEVVNLELEDFRPAPGTDLTALPERLEFATGVYRQPEGFRAKVSAPALVNDNGRVRRLKSVRLRLVPDSKAPVRQKSPDYPTTSVLASGTFYKVAVPERGVYRMDRGFLADALEVAGLDGLDPRNFKIYGLPGGKLTEPVTDDPLDDLRELAILVQGEEDGNFDGGDAIYFYAEGPDRETYDNASNRFVFEPNVYTERNYYYLRVDGGPGSRVRARNAPANLTYTTDSYDAFYHFEEEKMNILHELGQNSHGSGQFWFGEFFREQREKNYPNLFRIPGLVTDEPVRVTAQMALRTDVRSRFRLVVNGQELTSAQANSIRFGAQEQNNPARLTRLDESLQLSRENVDIEVVYPRPAGSNNSEAWLDYLELRARRRLSFAGDAQFVFTDTRVRQSSGGVAFQLTDPDATTQVWRVDGGPASSATVSGNSFNFSTEPDVAGTYVAFRTSGSLPAPEAAGRVENQNLHGVTGAGMIIVTYPDFLSQAERLAEHRRAHNGLTVTVVTTEQVYNEFSSGRDDPAAIRNFARMIYERDPGLRYLLLFGDGSFDHRNVLEAGTNFIPTFQVDEDNSFTEVETFPSDDFFGIFTAPRQGNPLGPPISIGIGRLPVKSSGEGTAVVDKLIRYDTDPETLGDWRTRMVFVGDDEDGGAHVNNGQGVNGVARTVAQIKPDLNFDKLYFDLFPQQSISAGERYPDVTSNLDRAVFRGSLAITYLGHGGPSSWAQERVLTIPQIRNWSRNDPNLDPIQPPIFVTATCTFTNYDDPTFVSAGEEILLTPNGGSIALLSTTRPVFARSNFALTRATMRAMTERVDGEWRTLGDVIRIAKNETAAQDNSASLAFSTTNVRKYTLVGDPATIVALPEYRVRTTMIDTLPVDSSRADTVRALQKMRISGEVIDLSGNILDDFNGQVFPTIYDKPQQLQTLGQDPGSPVLTFEVQRNIVFRGKSSVRDGKFSFEFVAPRDIDYAFGRGKVSYYARDRSSFTDAAGSYDGLVIGGTAEDVVADDEGPLVEVFLNDNSFVAGGQTDEDPVLLVELTDDLGINVTGNSIGHDLEAVLDEDTRNPIVLNDYYEANEDDFRSGTVRFPLFDLEPGKHTVSVRAWDVANNSAKGQTEFIVAEDGGDALRRVLNYPNPFTDRTCFQFDHTLVGQEVEAIVQVYTVAGRLVKTLRQTFPFSDGSVRQDDCIEWDGLDDYGDLLGRGVYLYQVRLLGEDRRVLNGDMEKLVILK